MKATGLLVQTLMLFAICMPDMVGEDFYASYKKIQKNDGLKQRCSNIETFS